MLTCAPLFGTDTAAAQVQMRLQFTSLDLRHCDPAQYTVDSRQRIIHNKFDWLGKLTGTFDGTKTFFHFVFAHMVYI